MHNTLRLLQPIPLLQLTALLQAIQLVDILQPLMAGRAMATAQGRIRILRSSTLPREDGAEPNRTVINFAGRHSLSTSPDHAGASEVPDSPHRRAASALVHRGFAAEKFSIGVPI